MKLSIILNTCNHLELTKKYLPKMIKTCGVEDHEVIINDNSTDPAMYDWLEEMHDRYGWDAMLNFKNIGNPQGINRALTHAKGEYIAKIDPDFTLPENWGEKAIEVNEIIGPSIGLVGFHWARGLNHPDLQKGECKHGLSVVDLHHIDVYIPIKVFGVWIFHRSLIHKVGCFYDKASKYGVWDSEFQQRCKHFGYINVYHPDDSIHHGTDIGEVLPDGRTFREFKDGQAKIASENMITLHEKWTDSENFDYARFCANDPK